MEEPVVTRTSIRSVGAVTVRLPAILALATAGVLSAGTLTLEPVLIEQLYQQTENSPCFIGDPSCKTGGLGDKTVLDPNVDSYDAYSPEYSGALLNSLFPTGFIVGIDVNQTEVDQLLSFFEWTVNGLQIDVFDIPNTPVPPTVGGGNGTGYADYILTGFTFVANPGNFPYPFADSDVIQFHVKMPRVNDGREQFFLIDANIVDIPEPATMALLGSGLIALGLYRWRKRTS